MVVLAQPGRVHLGQCRLGAAPLLPAVASVALLLCVLGSERTSQPPSLVALPSGRSRSDGDGGLGVRPWFRCHQAFLCPGLASVCSLCLADVAQRGHPCPVSGGCWAVAGASHLAPSLTVLLNSDLK